MKTKHTPGPWICDGADILAPETRFRGKDEPLASMNIESNKWPFDARLIAAAPDLLETTKRFYEISMSPKSFSDTQYEESKYELEKAIEKAEGRDE